MIRTPRILGVAVMAMLVAAPSLAASPPNPPASQAAAVAAGDRLIDVQLDGGGFPWIVGDPSTWQNVQGITAQGLLAAYDVSFDQRYIDAATKVKLWLGTYFAEPANANAWASSGTVFFLAEYATRQLSVYDMAFARAMLERSISLVPGRPGNFPATPTGLVKYLITARKAQGHTNLGLWDAALFIRAAQDAGEAAIADEMATALVEQIIVDAFDSTANEYELGLSGLLFGLAEADLLGNQEVLTQARDALVTAQAEDGSVPNTWQTTKVSDVQATAYAAIGLAAVGEIQAAAGACGYLVESQAEHGGWALGEAPDTYEIAEVDSEGAMALAQCAQLVPQGVVNYTDEYRPAVIDGVAQLF